YPTSMFRWQSRSPSMNIKTKKLPQLPPLRPPTSLFPNLLQSPLQHQLRPISPSDINQNSSSSGTLSLLRKATTLKQVRPTALIPCFHIPLRISWLLQLAGIHFFILHSHSSPLPISYLKQSCRVVFVIISSFPSLAKFRLNCTPPPIHRPFLLLSLRFPEISSQLHFFIHPFFISAMSSLPSSIACA